MRTKVKKSQFYSIIILSVIFSHKFIELLFSNLLNMLACKFKVKSVLKINTQNPVRYVSILVSLMVFIAASLLFVDQRSFGGYLSWESIDVMIMSAISAFITYFVTKRKPDDYQNSIDQSFEFEQHGPNDNPQPVIQF